MYKTTECVLDEIEVPETLPRKVVDISELMRKAESLSKQDLPLVTVNNKLLVGELYYRVLKLKNFRLVECVEATEVNGKILASLLKEYIKKGWLNIIEISMALDFLNRVKGIPQKQLGQVLGLSRVAVTNKLRLLKLPYQAQDALVNGKISEGHARALLSLKEEDLLVFALERVLRENYSVRETEKLVREILGKEKKSRRHDGIRDFTADTSLNKLVITFESLDSLQKFVSQCLARRK